MNSTDTVLNLMIVWTINTGVITALLSIVILIAVRPPRSTPDLACLCSRLIASTDLPRHQFARAGFHFVVLTIGLVSFDLAVCRRFVAKDADP